MQALTTCKREREKEDGEAEEKEETKTGACVPLLLLATPHSGWTAGLATSCQRLSLEKKTHKFDLPLRNSKYAYTHSLASNFAHTFARQ